MPTFAHGFGILYIEFVVRHKVERWSSLLLSVLFLLGIVSCNKSNTFKIFGEVPSRYATEGMKVYLSFDNDAPIDSTFIERGRFYFEGTYADSLSLRTAYITFESGSFDPLIIEKGNIYLRVPKYATGTPLNELFTHFRETLDSVRGVHHSNLYALREKGFAHEVGEKLLDSLYQEMQCEISKISIDFIAQHSNNLAGGLAFSELLRNSATILSTQEIDKLADILEPIINKNDVIKKQIERFKNRVNTSPGNKFVDFIGVNLTNEEVALSDYVGKGKYILLDFWASWCSSCRKVFPELLELQASQNPDKFQIVGVFVWDSREHLKKEYNTSPEAFPLIIDEMDNSTFTYGVHYLPEFILFDPKGNIVKRGLLDEGMKSLINKLVAD